MIFLVGITLLVQGCTTPAKTEPPIPAVIEEIITVTPSEDISPVKGLTYNLLFSRGNRLYLFDASTGKTTLHVLSVSELDGVTLSPDGSYLAYKNDSGIFLSKYPFESSIQVALFDPGFWDLAWNPRPIINSTGDRLAYMDREGVFVWNIANSSATQLLAHPEPVGDDNTFINPYRWSPDGQWLIVLKATMEYYEFWILNTTTKKMLPISVNRQSEIEWLPDSTRMVAIVNYDCMALTGFKDGIYLLEIKHGELTERRIYHEATNPECGERDYSLLDVDPANDRILFYRYMECETGSCPVQLVDITFDGKLIAEIPKEDIPIEYPAIVPDRFDLFSIVGKIYEYDPATTKMNIVYERPADLGGNAFFYTSPDNGWILVREHNDLFLIDLSTRARYPVISESDTDKTEFIGWVPIY